jgi:fimbrial chaperone protein
MKKLILVFFLLIFILPIYAFQFEPITQDFSPSGLNTRRSFQLINTSENPIAVKISMVYRKMDLYGVETLTDASKLFFVYPSQVIVQPASTQTVRVQWLGNPEVSMEQPFRIIAEQLPININRDNSGVNILIAYHGTIYVIPDTFNFGLEVISVRKDVNETGEDVLLLELENTGNTHIILEEPVIKIKNSSQILSDNEITLTAENLTGLTNENILAGKHRVFSVPWPAGLKNGNLNATLILETKR